MSVCVNRIGIVSAMKAKSNKKKLPVRKDAPMKDNELSGLTIKELKELQVRIESAIAARATEERLGLREKFREMAEAAGLSLADVIGGGGARGGKSGKVAAKFANPSVPQETWSGRGRQPRWLVARLKAGAKLDDFRL